MSTGPPRSPSRSKGLVIAIDGPSAAGKSTGGRALAQWLGYTFLDTGAMYRALALKALREAVPLDRPAELAALARSTAIELADLGRVILLDGEDVTAKVRTPEVSAATSRISAHSEVRREMVARQRRMGREGGVVLDGRDIGTAVFPDADVKFYLDADPRQRASRRHKELAAMGTQADPVEVEREILERDRADTIRRDSPLVRAPDAWYLDTTFLTPEEVLARMLEIVVAPERRGPSP